MKLFYLKTFGCQMNVYDTGIIESILLKNGFKACDDALIANLIIVNTCSVRKHAELHSLKKIQHYGKTKLKDAKLIVVGCMAKRLGENLKKEVPEIDYILAPDDYEKIPDIIKDSHSENITSNNNIKSTNNDFPYADKYTAIHFGNVSSFVSITRGCNNFCTYCIVPYVRGREVSRKSSSVISEIKNALKAGVKEIVLLGQNVNSYKDKDINFPSLLRKIDQIEGDFRVRFLTSHPKDLSDELIDVISEDNKICTGLHLPMQAGSDKVLKWMNRKYTKENYLMLVEKIRAKIPDIYLTTDIMVGTPVEEEKDFEETLDIVKKIQFSDAFMYKYSERPGTKACSDGDKIPEEEKLRRLNKLIHIQKDISSKTQNKMIGQEVEILFEKKSKKGNNQWWGKTKQGLPAVADGTNIIAGDFKKAIIKSSTGATLITELKE